MPAHSKQLLSRGRREQGDHYNTAQAHEGITDKLPATLAGEGEGVKEILLKKAAAVSGEGNAR